MTNYAPPTVPPMPPTLPRRGPDLSSVPKILLGLGAFCLLSAAVIFLAVSWSTMGIGARTAVLAGLTLGAVAGTLTLLARRLTIAAEAMSAVALGFLVLDVYGASTAGLVHGMSAGTTTLAAGIVLVLGAAGFSITATLSLPRLIAPQVALGVGLLMTYVGGSIASDHDLLVGNIVIAVASATALGARRAGLPVAIWSCLAAMALTWTSTTSLASLAVLLDPSLHALWIDGNGWSLLCSAAALLVPGVALHNQRLLLIGGSGTALIATALVTAPTVDESFTAVALSALAATAAWGAFLQFVRGPLRIIGFAPAAAGSAILLAVVVTVAAGDLAAWASAEVALGHPFLLHLDRPHPPVAPWVVVPAALVLAVVLAIASSRSGRPSPVVWGAPAALVTVLATALAVASYDVALVVPTSIVGLAAIGAAVFCAASRGTTSETYAAVAVALGAVSVVAALPGAGATALATVLSGVAVLVVASRADTRGARIAAECAFVPFAAAGVPALVLQLGHDTAWIAVPLLMVVGLIALLRPVEWVEVPAVIAATLALPVSLSAADDGLALVALWLLVAACICGASGLLHEHRRPLVAAGGVLLLLATWIRLGDLDVRIPEAYTLPLAIALVAVGLHHLHRNRDAGSAAALMPGLLLGTLPTLIQVIEEPVSLRALLLGTACLGLVLFGAGVRWSAPLLTGAAVGATVVLREVGPYAHVVPQWAWIGLAGVVLTAAGITWERQLREMRGVFAAVARLR